MYGPVIVTAVPAAGISADRSSGCGLPDGTLLASR